MNVPESTGPIRVLLVDDHRLVRSGFALILSVADGIEVVGQAADGAEAIEQARAQRPDVVLMDVQMPGVDGITATKSIAAEQLGRVIILTTFDRDDYLFAGLDAGASGFLLKNTDPDHLLEAVRAVAHGHALLAPEVTRRVIEARVSRRTHPATPPGGPAEAPAARPTGDRAEPTDALVQARLQGLAQLTDRERDVLHLVALGLSNAEIAGRLVVGEATVKTHVSSILAKLHVRDRIQAVVFAYEAGVVGPLSG